MTLTDISTVLIGLAVVPSILFVILYTRSPWRGTPMGRHVMGYGLIVSLLLSLSLINRVFGDFPGKDLLYIVLFVTLIVILWRQVLFLIRAQRGDD